MYSQELEAVKENIEDMNEKLKEMRQQGRPMTCIPINKIN